MIEKGHFKWTRCCVSVLFATLAVMLHAAESKANRTMFATYADEQNCSGGHDAAGRVLWGAGAGFDSSNNQVCNIATKGVGSEDADTSCPDSAVKQIAMVVGRQTNGLFVIDAVSAVTSPGVTQVSYTLPNGCRVAATSTMF